MNFEEQIKKIMENPEALSKVMDIAGAIGASQSGGESQQSLPVPPLPALNDDRTRLLAAIKPFLSEKRAPYMDSALTILRMMSITGIGKDLKK